MPQNFNPARPAKGFPRALQAFFAALRGGLVQDFARISTGASAVLAQPTVYETRIRTDGSGLQRVVQIPPAPGRVGARHLISLAFEAAAGDSVRVTAGAGARLRREELHVDGVTGFSPETITNLDLGGVNDFVLLEWLGGSSGDWCLIYASAGVTVS